MNPATTEPVAPLPRLLLVDDEEAILGALRRVFRLDGYHIDVCAIPMEALHMATANPYDVVISDMRMPVMDGAAFLQAIANFSPNTMRLLLTGYSDQEATVRAINLGRIHGYLHKPWDNDQLRTQVANCIKAKQENDKRSELTNKLQRLSFGLTRNSLDLEKKLQSARSELEQTASFLDCAYQELKDNFNATIQVLAQLVHVRLRDDDIGHLVAVQCEQILERIDCPEEIKSTICHAAQLCQIGKLALPDRLLGKPLYKLSAEDRKLYDEYPSHGERWLFPVVELQGVGHIILHHQEHYDGSGEPNGLSGNEIPLGSRLLKILLDFNLMLAGKIDPLLTTPEGAANYLYKHAGTIYDADLVDIYLDLIHDMAQYDQLADVQVLSANSLQADMRICRDLISFDGVMLLVKGTVLTQRTIVRLRQWEKQHGVPINVSVKINV